MASLLRNLKAGGQEPGGAALTSATRRAIVSMYMEKTRVFSELPSLAASACLRAFDDPAESPPVFPVKAASSIVRLARRGGLGLVPGGVDCAAAEALLADASFWAGLEADDAARLAGIAERIHSELAEKKPGAEAMATACAVELVVLAIRLAERQPPAGRPWKAPDGVWSIDDAVRYIESNYTESFSLDWFVGKCAMNVSDFSRRFKERAGCPLFEFINRQRVARACALLKSSGLSIIDIAEAVGYNNLSFFNRYFLRIVGVSPREYRSS